MKSRRAIPHVFLLPLFLGALLLIATPAHAHVTGASFTSTTTPYVVDIGYDPITFTAEESERFDFVLRDEKTGNPVPFDQVWVRITDGDNTLLATGLLNQSIGPTTLLYVFGGPGEYKLQPSFRNADGDEIAAATFPISVAASSDTSFLSTYAPWLLFCVLGLIGGFLLARFVFRRG